MVAGRGREHELQQSSRHPGGATRPLADYVPGHSSRGQNSVKGDSMGIAAGSRLSARVCARGFDHASISIY